MLERRRLSAGITVAVSPELEARGFLVAVTERSGGVSGGPFRSLNLGFSGGDDPRMVRTNRRRACGALGLGSFAVARQIHGSHVEQVGTEQAGTGFDGPSAAMRTADVLTTSAPGVAVAVLAADCVPVALADPGTGRLAVVHAGWRGIAAGVLASALELFDDRAAICAVIGPAIGPDHYEVGEEVVEAVAAATDDAVVARRSDARSFLDLPLTVARFLTRNGVSLVDRATECTACEAARFFSHRRDGPSGRQAMVAVRLV
jgi:YfiH family protein